MCEEVIFSASSEERERRLKATIKVHNSMLSFFYFFDRVKMFVFCKC